MQGKRRILFYFQLSSDLLFFGFDLIWSVFSLFLCSSANSFGLLSIISLQLRSLVNNDWHSLAKTEFLSKRRRSHRDCPFKPSNLPDKYFANHFTNLRSYKSCQLSLSQPFFVKYRYICATLVRKFLSLNLQCLQPQRLSSRERTIKPVNVLEICYSSSTNAIVGNRSSSLPTELPSTVSRSFFTSPSLAVALLRAANFPQR